MGDEARAKGGDGLITIKGVCLWLLIWVHLLVGSGPGSIGGWFSCVGGGHGRGCRG
jgi:hypothetical protein